MREQQGFTYTQTGQGQRIQRKSLVTSEHQKAVRQPPASPHRAGHDAGIHPEDMPYQSGRPTQRYVEEEELEEDDTYYSTRMPTSARRYQAPPDKQIVRQGNRQFIIHNSPPQRQRLLPPPRRREEYLEELPYQKERRHVHWLVWLGLAMLVMIAGWVVFSNVSNLWQQKQDDWTYGQSPRHYTIDAVVGHNDSASNPSHFIAENDKGDVFVVELPGGDTSKAHIYQITSIPGNTGNPPVKVSFQDINHDGKLDMYVEIGDPGSMVTVILFNNGSQFVSKL